MTQFRLKTTNNAAIDSAAALRLRLPTASISKPLKQNFAGRATACWRAVKAGFYAFPVISTANLTFGIARAVIPVVAISFTGKIIDALQKSLEVTPEVLWSGAAVLGLISSTYLIGSLAGQFSSVIRNRLQLLGDLRMFEAVSRRDIKTMRSSADATENIKTRDELWRWYGIQNDVVGLLGAAIEVGAAVYLIAKFDLLALGLITAFAIPRALIGAAASRAHHEMSKSRAEDRKKFFWRRWSLMCPEDAEGVKLLGRFREIMGDVLHHGRRWVLTEERLSWKVYRRSLGAELLSAAALGFAIYNSIQLTVVGAISIGGLSIMLGASQRFYSALAAFFGQFNTTDGSLRYLVDVENYLGMPQSADLVKVNPSTKQVNWSSGVDIEFRNVSFAYPAADGRQSKVIFSGLNLKIPAGSMVGLVGENGAGKSTLAALLLKLRSPDSGDILIGGISISQIPEQELRENMAAHLQESRVIHSYSLRDSIGHGAPLTREGLTIERAAELSGLKSFIESGDIKHGLDTVLGDEFDKGAWLSGGQMQTVKAARALVRDAAVLVLDEPGNSLDAFREEGLLKNLVNSRHAEGNRGSKTTLVVSHDFSTLIDADVILVIGASGEGIIEAGTHAELVRKTGGAYRKMYLTKALRNIKGLLPALSEASAEEMRRVFGV